MDQLVYDSVVPVKAVSYPDGIVPGFLVVVKPFDVVNVCIARAIDRHPC
jgi:hypothetical protein